MIKYFKELEDIDKQYLCLIERNLLKSKNIEQENLPISFYEKYSSFFNTIEELDPLYNKLFNKGTKLIDSDKLYNNYYNIDMLVDSIMNNMDNYNEYGMSDSGKIRIDYMIKQYKDNSKAKHSDDYYDYYDLKYYIESAIELMSFNNVISSKSDLNKYLKSVYILLENQNKLTDELEQEFQSIKKELKEYRFKIKKKEFKPCDMRLPNSWFITPYNHLYNSMGADSHKESNLEYPYYQVHMDKLVYNPKSFLNEIKEIEKNQSVNIIDYEHYLNLIYDFPTIYPEQYYNLNKEDRIKYRQLYKVSHSPKLIKLIIGIVSAHAGFYSFFYELKKYDTFDENLKYIENIDFDEVLVRCCRFHKISSIANKTITTSSLNYENDFKEYIDRGWTIDFVPPIILDENKKLKEYDNSLVKIRKLKRY